MTVLRLLLACLVVARLTSGMSFKTSTTPALETSTTSTTPTPAQCGYAACSAGRPDMLNIHLVPHGHSDTGWLKTVDQYFYGSRNNLQNVGIQYNIDAVVQGLSEDPRRRYTWIEIAYFWRWWGEQSAAKQNLVRQLIARGQLMFGNNAWEMNDEASVLYQEIIDQHTLGERFLTETFGACARPMTAWQIDTFGHSREFASLLAQMGHDSLYFARLDYQDKANRIAKKSMEMMWKGSDDLGQRGDLFTGVLYNHYSPPNGFCYSCGDDPIMDDPRLFDYNVDAMIDKFLAEMVPWAKAFATNHILIPMGSDFDYELANRWFVNQDKIIKYVNARQAKGSKINVLYSTVPCYTYAVHSTAANHSFPEKTDDFFPYASRAHTFWTGSFTSRPTCKGYVRDSNAFLQTCKQLSVMAGISALPDVNKAVDHLRRGVAIDVNHGQMPGTQRQLVAYDNMLRLANGSAECLKVVGRSLDILSPVSQAGVPAHCTLLNISQCRPLEKIQKQMPITVHNPLSRTVTHWLRLPVTSPEISILDANGHTLPADLSLIPARTLAIPERNTTAKYEVIVAAVLPPMGFTTLTVHHGATGTGSARPMMPIVSPSMDNFYIANEFLRLDFSGSTNLLQRIICLKTGQATTAQIDIRYYTAFVGDNSKDTTQASGAYIFRPAEQTPYQFSGVNVRVLRGTQVQEVHQKFSTWASLVTRLYKGSPYVEVEWTVGPIPYQQPGNIGKEVIINYQSGLKSNGTVYTDSVGRQMLRRVRNYRPTWKFVNTEPVSGNYYPLNTAMYLRDEAAKTQLTVLVDRAQGGGSLTDGQMEIMVHRRLGADDNLGVGEALNELGSDKKGLIARGRHLLLFNLFNSSTASPALMRDLTAQVQSRPTVLVRPGGAPKVPQWSALRAELPINAQVLTLDGWTDGKVLVRLEHPFQKGEDAQWSKPVSLNLATLFSGMMVTEAEEMSLAGAMPLSEMKRMQWRSSTKARGAERASSGGRGGKLRGSNMTVTLQPTEIRTFVMSAHRG